MLTQWAKVLPQTCLHPNLEVTASEAATVFTALLPKVVTTGISLSLVFNTDFEVAKKRIYSGDNLHFIRPATIPTVIGTAPTERTTSSSDSAVSELCGCGIP